MKKEDEVKDVRSCFNRAGPESRLFVLLDWDPAAPAAIRFWAMERVKRGLNRHDDPQLVEARALADEMDARLAEVRAERARGKVSLNPAAAWPFPASTVA